MESEKKILLYRQKLKHLLDTYKNTKYKDHCEAAQEFLANDLHPRFMNPDALIFCDLKFEQLFRRLFKRYQEIF